MKKRIKIMPMPILIIMAAAFMLGQSVFVLPQNTLAGTVKTDNEPVKLYWDTDCIHKTLGIGERFKLKKILRPKGSDVKYSSKKRTVAKVSASGMVTALKKGSTDIIAKNKRTKETIKFHIHVGGKVKKVIWKNAGKAKVVYMGEKFDFDTKCYPANAAYRKVMYKSSDPKVLKVSQKGVVKPLKNGTVTITAKAKDQGGKKVKCKVAVKTKVSSVRVTASGHICFVGEKLKLESEALPQTASNKSVKWKSSKKKIATVSGTGYVKGIKSGTVKISAVAKDGSGKKGSYTVYVVDKPDPSKIWFNAHRGYSGRYPENTLQAFTAAAGMQFSGIETDIWENSTFYAKEDIDRHNKTNPEFIIMHDQTLKKMCGVDLDVKKLTAQSINNYPVINGNGNDPAVTYKIPVLEEYVDIMAASGKTLVIELKDDNFSPDAASKLIGLLDSKGVSGRTYIISFEKNSLLNVKNVLGERNDIKFTRILGVRNKGNFENEIKWSIENKMDEVTFNSAYLKDEYIRELKQAGLEVGVWTVDDKYKAADYIRRGCDHVTTNTDLWR